MAACAAPLPEETKDDVIPAFVDTIEELLSGLREVFPECQAVNRKWLKFRAFVKPADETDEHGNVVAKAQIKLDGAKMLMKDWHNQMGPHYETCRRRDIKALLESDLQILKDLDMRTKWNDPSFDAESRDTLFQYIDTLNMYAQMQFIPSKMLHRIQGVAQMLADEYSSGQFDLAKVDIFAIGQKVMENTSEQELMEMASNMGQLQAMMRMGAPDGAPAELQGLASMVGNLAGGGGGAPSGGRGMDPMMLMQMMNSFQPK